MVEESEVTQEPEELTPKKPRKEFWIKLVTGILFVATWIVLIIIATQSDMSLTVPLIISIVLSIVLIAGFFSSWIYKKMQGVAKASEEEIQKPPEPLTEDEAKERIKDVLTNDTYGDHISGYRTIEPFNIKSDLIYHFQVDTIYSKEVAHIIINANYPKRQPAIFYNTRPSLRELRRAINLSSTHPMEEPDIEKSEIFDPLRQVFIKTEKRQQKQKEKSKSKKKEESLI